jgi:hypothetical protein
MQVILSMAVTALRVLVVVSHVMVQLGAAASTGATSSLHVVLLVLLMAVPVLGTALLHLLLAPVRSWP